MIKKLIFKIPLTFICIFVLLIQCNNHAQANIKDYEKETISLFERLSPSVVFIKNASIQLDWFSTTIYEIPRGAGSGFVWDRDGHIITNFHVIYQSDKIEVTLANQETYEARIVGISPDHDLAVLKIDAPREALIPLPIGTSDKLKVGQSVLAIGNPFGLDSTLTTGVISALGRSIKTLTGRKIHDSIQTDAAINPGNSGGPLIDSSGNLIGVNTTIYSPSGAFAGVGFAIPVNIVRRIIPQLILYGKVKKVGLGVVLVPDSIRRRLGFDRGAMILELQQRGAGELAGLKETRRNFFNQVVYGDVIIALDDRVIEGNEDVIEFLEAKNEGANITIRFIRGAKEFTTTANLQEL